jgi:hypothetical protein
VDDLEITKKRIREVEEGTKNKTKRKTEKKVVETPKTQEPNENTKQIMIEIFNTNPKVWSIHEILKQLKDQKVNSNLKEIEKILKENPNQFQVRNLHFQIPENK